MTFAYRYSKHLMITTAVCAFLGVMLVMKPGPSSLERVLSRGELVVITRPSTTTYYHDQYGPTGMEYELAKGFAESLGVRLRLLESDDLNYIQYAIRKGTADMAAAGLVATPARSAKLQFTRPYQHVDTLLVRRISDPRVRNMSQLSGKRIAVAADTSHAELIESFRDRYPDVEILPVADATPELLLSLVESREIDHTLINSNSFALQRTLYPELVADHIVANDQPLAWAFNPRDDESLLLAAQRYLTRANADGTLAQLENRFYGHMELFDFYSARSFMHHLSDRLPRYEETFKKAAQETGFDWRLLAALGYQESHWNPRAVSPTGVRGLMMLTNITAREMGIHDRTDPTQSIMAGAHYLRRVHDRIPADVPEPDRTWMAMASYNVGFGHVMDARRLTARQGGDPNVWDDVNERLPLLANPAYRNQLRYGNARGGQAVVYVRHIRRYYDLLIWSETSRRSDTMVALAD